MAHIASSEIHSVLKRNMLADGMSITLDLERSAENYIVDGISGRRYLDCFSFYASNPIGHGHPKLNDAGFERELLRAAKTKPANSDIYTEPMAEFVDTFARLVMPKELPHLFFVSGGSLAVENALKTAFDWKVRKNFAKGVSGERGQQVIHFREAFHGRSGYTLSLTNTDDPRKTMYFPKFSWPRITNPKISFPLEKNLDDIIKLEQLAEQEIKTAFQQNSDDIAAIIIEPIQGEGGDNHFRPEFLRRLRHLADENEALLIFDEVQTGAGITGSMWAFQKLGVVPDIIAFGKKTQVCGICVGPRIEEVQDHVFSESSRINSTWGGALVDMVRSRRYFEIIEEDKLVENAAKVGEYLQDALQAFTRRHQHVLGNSRGSGLFCAFDVCPKEKRGAIIDAIFRHGALVLASGTFSIRLRPSLTFTEKDVDTLVDILDTAVAEVCPA